MSLRELDGEILHRVKEHLVDDSSLSTYRLALEKIGRRLDDDSPCQEAWGELCELRTKGILQRIIIPEVTFRPPDTLIDALDFFKQASCDYDDPKIPVEQRGVSFVLKLRSDSEGSEAGVGDDPFAIASDSNHNNRVPVIPALSARYISLYDVLKLVCDVTGYKLRLRGGLVMIVPFDDPDQ